MNIETSGNAESRAIEPGKVDTHFSLDLRTVDALDPERIAEDLEARRNHIRGQIFREIANEVVPSMLEGRQLDIPEQWSIDSSSRATSKMESPNVSGGVLNTGHHLEMDFSFQADREIDPVTMVYLAREQVASHIADSTVFDLEHRFLGKTEFSVSSESSREDGVVDEYRVTEETKDPGEGKEKPVRQQDVPQQDMIFERVVPEENDLRQYGEGAGNDDSFVHEALMDRAGNLKKAVNEEYYDRVAFLEYLVEEDKATIREAKARLLEYRWNRKEARRERRWADVVRWTEEMHKAEEELREDEEMLATATKWLKEAIAKREDQSQAA